MLGSNSGIPLLHTKNFRGDSISWLVVASCCLLFAAYIIDLAFVRDIYPNLGMLVGGLMMASFGMLSVKIGVASREIIIYSERIEMRSILSKFNRVLFWEDIIDWYETEEKQKGQLVHTIVFESKEKMFHLDSKSYNEYPELLALFRTFRKDYESTSSNELSYGFVAGLGIAAIIMIVLSYTTWNKGLSPINQSSLIIVSGPITHNGIIYKGNRGARYIDIGLANFPEWRFHFDGDAYNATKRSAYVSGVRKGDTIELAIEKEEYHKKILGNATLSLWDKIADYRFIDVYSLSGKTVNYLVLADYNSERSDTFLSGCTMFLGIVLLMIAYGMLLYKTNLTKRY